MPCNCDYMEPSRLEVLGSRVACLLDELRGTPINKTYWNGYHPRVYNQTYDRYSNGCGGPTIEAMEAELVEKLRSVDVSDYSLEMQVWWRDFSDQESRKFQDDLAEVVRKEIRAAALAKLTEEEKKILGLEG